VSVHRVLRLCALSWCLLCALVASAHAQPQARFSMRAVAVSWRGNPALSFSARDFIDAEVTKKLQSGLPQTLITRLYAYSERDPEPVAVAALSCRVVYDLWEGEYRIERQTEKSDRTLSVKSLEGVLSECLVLHDVSLGDANSFTRQRGHPVYFAVAIELNPLSQDTIQRIRRWLARPAGSELTGNAFFGSFVSIFVGRKLGSAEKVLSFRSELMVVPP
jgi:hypothetical protein